MLFLLLVLLFLFWFTGFVSFPGLNFSNIVLFYFNGKGITLSELLIFFIILWILSVLIHPIRKLVIAIFIVWLLNVFGIITVTGLPTVLVIGIILILVYSMVGHYWDY